ncbi:hypothetical protein B0J14DRAFT_674005 [Halenospora varia]|nr:hypothetical protein B0J14DRAFT_674005 [Halenospora varia]
MATTPVSNASMAGNEDDQSANNTIGPLRVIAETAPANVSSAIQSTQLNLPIEKAGFSEANVDLELAEIIDNEEDAQAQKDPGLAPVETTADVPLWYQFLPEFKKIFDDEGTANKKYANLKDLIRKYNDDRPVYTLARWKLLQVACSKVRLGLACQAGVAGENKVKDMLEVLNGDSPWVGVLEAQFVDEDPITNLQGKLVNVYEENEKLKRHWSEMVQVIEGMVKKAESIRDGESLVAPTVKETGQLLAPAGIVETVANDTHTEDASAKEESCVNDLATHGDALGSLPERIVQPKSKPDDTYEVGEEAERAQGYDNGVVSEELELESDNEPEERNLQEDIGDPDCDDLAESLGVREEYDLFVADTEASSAKKSSATFVNAEKEIILPKVQATDNLHWYQFVEIFKGIFDDEKETKDWKYARLQSLLQGFNIHENLEIPRWKLFVVACCNVCRGWDGSNEEVRLREIDSIGHILGHLDGPSDAAFYRNVFGDEEEKERKDKRRV